MAPLPSSPPCSTWVMTGSALPATHLLWPCPSKWVQIPPKTEMVQVVPCPVSRRKLGLLNNPKLVVPTIDHFGRQNTRRTHHRQCRYVWAIKHSGCWLCFRNGSWVKGGWRRMGCVQAEEHSTAESTVTHKSCGQHAHGWPGESSSVLCWKEPRERKKEEAW